MQKTNNPGKTLTRLELWIIGHEPKKAKMNDVVAAAIVCNIDEFEI